jgi:tetratricopeptide (TPR) repeat protein
MGAYYRLVRKDFARARTEYEAAYRAAPRDVASVSGMASLLSDMGRIDEALRYYDEALRLDPRNALVHAVKSRLQLRLGHVAEARASAAAAAAIAPASLGVLNARLDVELAAGDSAAVRRLLGAAAQTIPQTSVLTYLGMFGISWLLDSADQERLVALAPDAYGGDHATWALVRARHAWWRGDARARRAWGDSATRYLRAQVADVPDDFSAHGNLAEALAHAGQPAEAVREARRGLDLARAQASSDGGLLYYFALVNAAFAASAAGDRDAALTWLAELRSMSGLFSPARVRIDPFFAPLRGDPRFEAVLRAR